MGYTLVFTRRAQKDAAKLEAAGLKKKAVGLLRIISQNPYQTPPPYEGLVGDLKGFYSRRINIQHRLLYEVLEQERVVKIYAMWTHYG